MYRLDEMIINFSIKTENILEEPQLNTIDDYPKIVDRMINERFIQEQILKDIQGIGINEKIKEITINNFERILKALKGGKSAKNGKKSRSIQKDCCKNKKDKC